MPTCPKCKHCWGAKKAKAPGVEVEHSSGPFEQKCWGCETFLPVGTEVIAADNMPVVWCFQYVKDGKAKGSFKTASKPVPTKIETKV